MTMAIIAASRHRSKGSTAMTDRPILMFDSGIGGLTVLREARVLMPDRRFVYIADDAGFPYGAWEEPALRERILTLFADLLKRFDPEISVIACNTASTLMMEALRGRFPGHPFVGTVPAIKPAAERTRSGLVSVLGTSGTVKRQYTRDLIKQWATKCHVRLVGSDNLAALAETYMRDGFVDEEAVRTEIAPCFLEQDGARTDIVVLACTHYPFLVNRMRKTAPWPVDWIDPAEAIARRALSLLAEQRPSIEPPVNGEQTDIAVFTSGKVEFTTRRLMQGFGLTVKNQTEMAAQAEHRFLQCVSPVEPTGG
jgi:glutamate racemase